MESHEVKDLVEEQRSLMIAVGVHKAQIEEVEADYKARRRTIAAELRRLGLDDPNPFADLWDWYAYWKEHLPTYASRRQHINALFQELLDALDHFAERRLGSGLHEASTGWERVDSQLSQLRERYATARSVEDFQAVGLLCRDILISVGDACYDHERHGGGNGKEPSGAMDKLEKVVGVEAAGGSNKQLRQLLKAAMEFSNHVQHDRAGRLTEAGVSAETTISLATLFRIVTVGAAPIGARAEPVPAVAADTDDDIPF